VTWVHVTEAYSFLRASQLYGPRRFTQADRDQYFEEMSAVATELVPTGTRSEADAEAYLRRIRPELYAGVQHSLHATSSCVGSPNVWRTVLSTR